MEVSSYDLRFDIRDDGSYDGIETVKMVCHGEPIYLHSSGLSIGSISVNGKAVSFREDTEREMILIEGTYSGECSVSVAFSGRASETLQGFYSAKTPSGPMYTTQFESTDARRMFPCVDEPSKKARFRVTVTVGRELDVVSNMPVDSVRYEGERKEVRFRETPRMSTYLIYIGVGKFDTRSTVHNGVSIGLVAPKGKLTRSDFPLTVAEKCLDFYEEYFDIKYALPKMDLISVPEFAAGAMENWGAITFREIYLDIDERTSFQNMKLIAEVIAHEIAHQWFGNLVTMEWWNDLWLNESFATFMSYKVIEREFPEMAATEDMVRLRTQSALMGDALRSSHPIQADVKDPSEIAQIFDEISYGKGASILRMIESFIGEEKFRDGIRNYLKEHMYGNARGSDLWNSLEKASGKPVTRIMEAWIREKGYPVLTVSRNGDSLHVSQKQFLLLNDVTDRRYPVPITVVREDRVESVLLEGRETQIGFMGFRKLNHMNTGFYRSLYADELLDHVLKHAGSASRIDRWGIANDAFAFLLSGLYDLNRYSRVVDALSQDTSFMLSDEISSQLVRLWLVCGDSVLPLARRYFDQAISHLGLRPRKGESRDALLARASVLTGASTIGLDVAREIADMVGDMQSIESEVHQAILIAYARTTNDFDTLSKILAGARTEEAAVKTINAMAWLSGQDRFQAVLGLIREGKIKRQDSWRFFGPAGENPAFREQMATHVSWVVDYLRKNYGGARASRTLEAVIPYVGLDQDIGGSLAAIEGRDTTVGIRKGLEVLEVHRRLRQRVRG
ncbi:leucyl aminopeptidase [Thermogymnomonas acidicola]|uniref:Aminopeptidase n=1 Tax=Thermogymnomonas acidicola TaxID=399579 RepID=A0AA37BQM0_9ARCH|nr:M1 family metallopeptidase [Thermogymnomonas acidicola]GGM70183.1 leucyl aminopeptidase [Thermogymnomonas acidicola]